jgi:translocation and assembly module TamB
MGTITTKRKILWVFLASLLLGAAALGLTLGTEKGRQTLLDAISSLTQSPTFALKMEGLRLGQTWTLERLTISDASGPWLEAENLGARPALLKLMTGTISILHAQASRIDVTRLPETGNESQSSSELALPPLRIRSMDVDRLHIGPEVVGHAASLSLHGELDLDESGPSAELRAARLDRPQDSLELSARLFLPEKTLDLRLDLNEEPQGVLHAALGVNGTQGISAHISGQGPVDGWNGRIMARLSDVAGLDGNATLALDGAYGADLSLLISPGSDWSRFTGLPQENLTITAHGQWQDETASITRLAVQSLQGEIVGNATFDLTSKTLSAEALAQADLSWLLPENIAAAPVSASASLRLDPQGLRTQGKITARDMTVSGLAVPAAETHFSLTSLADAPGWQALVRLDAQTPTLPQGLRSWSANATLGQDADSFFAQDLHVESERLGLAANGTMNGPIQVDTRLELRELSTGLLPGPLSATADAKIKGKLSASSLNASLDLTTVAVEGLPPELMQFLGQGSRLQVKFDVNPQRVDLHEALLQARTRARLSGQFDLEKNTFEASLRALLPEISAAALNMPSGAAVDAKATGKPESFTLNLFATARSVGFGDFSVSGINATALIPDLPSRPSATLRATALAAREPVSLELRVTPEAKALQFADCVLRVPDSTLTFSGDVDPATLLVRGALDFSSTDLAALGRILGTELDGQATLQAVLDSPQNRQRAVLKGQGQAMTISGLAIGQALVEGSVADPGLSDGTDLKVDLRSVGREDLLADSVDTRLRGVGADFGFTIDLVHKSSDTRLSSSGALTSDLSRLSVDALQGRLLRQPLALEAPFAFTSAPPDIAWQEARLAFGPSRLRTQGNISPGQADIRADLTDFDPALLRPLFPHLPSANVLAQFRVSGDPAQPDASLKASATSIRLESSGLEPLPGLDADADLRLSQNHLQAQASLNANSEIALDAQISSPLRLDLLKPDFFTEAPISGQLAGRAKLMLLPHFLRLDDQTLDGNCDLDFHVAGTWAQPVFTGTAQVRDARYENYRSGTILTNLNLDATAEDSILKAKLTATDSEEGKAQAVGQVDLLSFRHIFDVLFDRFRLLRHDLVHSTAKGGLRLQGNLDRTQLLGSMTLDPTSVHLPPKIPADLSQIEVQEINAARTRENVPKKASAFPVDLDLRVAIPARMSVQGRGLDSEWSGNLHAQGTQHQPVVTGEMNLLRGKFIFLDRTFDLTKGSVVLGGETPPNPFLEILGETQILDNLVQVRISGPARDFRLTLDSVPPLPQDELLAMILFGRSLRQISPLQAVRLAQAAAEMTGVGAGPDFLDSIKSQLGLQEVDVTKDEDDNTAVGVGGYLGGKYYIRTQSSVSGQDRTKVEVQITPKISVETEVGADSRQGGGVMWKHDY